tara:strand:+ start:2047 stop:3501 length:1455 start_codon:yes stop_codon:yes gene_type:complete
MKSIKNFKLFKESYSEDLEEVLDNSENQFIIMKGEDIIVGFEYITDCFDHLSELLEGDGAITEEQKYEFDEYVMESNVDDLSEQYDIEMFMEELLDKFEVVEPYKIIKRTELEDTPVDHSDEVDVDFDEIDTHEQERELSNKDLDEEYGTLLGESVHNSPFCIVGDIDGKEEEIDSFDSQDEADEFINDYKTIYNEFENIRVSPRMSNESFHGIDGKPIGVDGNHMPVVKNDADDADEWANEYPKCECCIDGECTCGDDCKCGDDCDCSDCDGTSVNEGWLNTVGDIVGIADPTGLVDLVNGLDYIRQGRYFYGFLSMISIIPYAGDAVAKPIMLLAKAGKMKGVTKAMKMAKAGDKAGAVKLLRSGAKGSKFGKFLKTAGEWGGKLDTIIDKIPEDKMDAEQKETIKGWIEIFVRASSSEGDEPDNINDNDNNNDKKIDNSDNQEGQEGQEDLDKDEELQSEEKVTERFKNLKIKTFSNFKNK